MANRSYPQLRRIVDDLRIAIVGSQMNPANRQLSPMLMGARCYAIDVREVDAHWLFMCDQILAFLDELKILNAHVSDTYRAWKRGTGLNIAYQHATKAKNDKLAKVHRWIGFLQGLVRSRGFRSLDVIAEQTRGALKLPPEPSDEPERSETREPTIDEIATFRPEAHPASERHERMIQLANRGIVRIEISIHGAQPEPGQRTRAEAELTTRSRPCPTCGALPDQICRRVSDGGLMGNTHHRER